MREPSDLADAARRFRGRALSTTSLVSLICMCLGSGPAQTGGLYVNEFATPSMGTAGAGAQAWADDAATAWHNAAGMTRIDGNEVTLGAGIGSIDAEFDTDPGTPVSSSDRTADMPVDEQFRFAVGAQHQLS